MQAYSTQNKTRVLVFIDWYDPGFRSGGPARSVKNMVQALHHEIDFFVVTRNTDYGMEDQPYKTIKPNSWHENGEASIRYISKDTLSVSEIRKIISETNFDVLYVNGIYSFYFSIIPAIFSTRSKKIIVCPRGMLSKQATEVKSTKKSLFLWTMKISGRYSKLFYHATSATEKHDIKFFQKKEENIFYIPNLPRKQTNQIIYKEKAKHHLRLIYLGRIAREKNLLHLLSILDNFKIEKIELGIYGSIYDEEYWNDCQKAIKNLPENISVEYKGILDSEKVPDELSRYHFMALPSLGENFGHSILESLSVGVPVLISKNTPWQNLKQFQAGFDLDLNDKTQWNNAIREILLLDTNCYKSMQDSAFQFAQKHTKTEENKTKYLKMFSIHK